MHNKLTNMSTSTLFIMPISMKKANAERAVFKLDACYRCPSLHKAKEIVLLSQMLDQCQSQPSVPIRKGSVLFISSLL